ncbi:MAG: TadE/TadG family type IV pilus assembly protein [Comamonas sp.]
MRIRACEQGVVAIEFSLIFPIFFLIFYAIVTYGLIFAAQQTVTLAAAEGARAAVRYQAGKDQDAKKVARIAAACDMSNQALAWLRNTGATQTAPASGVCATGITKTEVSTVTDQCSELSGVTCIKVLVTYDYDQAPLIPKLLGPLLSLPTPKALQGQAVAQISLVD